MKPDHDRTCRWYDACAEHWAGEKTQKKSPTEAANAFHSTMEEFEPNIFKNPDPRQDGKWQQVEPDRERYEEDIRYRHFKELKAAIEKHPPELKTEPGKKWDKGKLRYDLLPPDALAAVTQIFTDGAAKYGDRNWEQGISWSRCFAAAQRHLWAFWDRQDTDPESGSPHLAHAIVNIMFLLAYQSRGIGTDDRIEKEAP
jgi:hypothetical protein